MFYEKTGDSMLNQLISFLALWAMCVVAANASPAASPRPNLQNQPAVRVPVIYCSDLFHPHDDPDDHFDLATILAMREIDLKAIILDQGARQLQRPGTIPVAQMAHLTGRSVPVAFGLGAKLKSPADKALDQKPEYQRGVELILKVLRETPAPVRITTIGSVRDIVAAFNREPALFQKKVDRVLIFIGEASDPEYLEYNVELDPQAYIRLMSSGLPIYWVPCFDGGLWKNKGHASFWKARHADLLRDTSPRLLQYFIYALEQEKGDPIQFLDTSPEPGRLKKLFADSRNLWCTAVFGALSNRRVVLEGGHYCSFPANGRDSLQLPGNNLLFGFTPAEVSINEEAHTHVGKTPNSRKLMLFTVLDPQHYPEGMTQLTHSLLVQIGQ
jgi:hypothetical protein